jgi:hypothetical protein
VVRKLTSKKPEEEAPDPGAYEEEPYKSPLLPTEPGLHQVTWDLLMQGPETIKGARVDTGNPRPGPLVNPGDYTLRLTADGKAQTARLVVLPDPRQKSSLLGNELDEQLKLALRIRDDITALTRTVEALRAVRKQLVDRNKLIEPDKKSAELVKRSKALVEKLDKLEEQLHNPKAEVTYDILARKGGAKLYSQLAFLYEGIREADGPPTQGLREVYAEQEAALKKLQGEWEKLVGEDLEALNAIAGKLDLPTVIVPARK